VAKSAVVLAIAICSLAGASASAREARTRGPWPLVSLAALGTVTWRCDPTGAPSVASRLPALALGFRVAARGQTGHLTLTVARRAVRSIAIEPGETITLPFLRAPIQRMNVSEGGEDGTLRATVIVSFVRPFVSGYCWPYMPPKVDVQLTPRR
jgi:hypothetical protein